eukprot:480056-Ditylum_brightwellii.AAC.1
MFTLDYFSNVTNFLIIEEPFRDNVSSAQSADVGSHNLNCPHYQKSDKQTAILHKKHVEYTENDFIAVTNDA